MPRQIGESVVFIGEEPAWLTYAPARTFGVQVRSTYSVEPSTIQYEEDRDFIVDYLRGTIRRLPGSRLPDFRTNMLYGVEGFDHLKFPGFGNSRFIAFVDYDFVSSVDWPVQADQTQYLRRTQMKLKTGEPLKVVAYGDSV